VISEREASKYPFLKGTVDLVETLNLKIDDLADPSYGRILDRGEQRLSEAILKGVVSADIEDPLIEILSFPVALMFVTFIGDQFLDRRYALAEAVRVYILLRGEDDVHIARVARDEFDWDLSIVRREVDGKVYNFELHFPDYIRNATQFREDKWKLVNRMMGGGYVILTRMEAARLIQVEVERLIRSRVSRHSRIELPMVIREHVDRIRKLFDENRSRISGEELPSEVAVDGFPPCMGLAFERLISGRRASHMERFALTSFLVHAGMDLERIVKLFISVTDFDEQLTRYQIEHIAGFRGSRTKYTPPTCGTLKSHGICHNPDNLCRRIRHPLSYYRRKIRTIESTRADKTPNG
jgi:DNA primase large subunit